MMTFQASGRVFRPFSRGNGAASLRSREPLSDEQMMGVAPSIFATAPHESRSERYTQIPTSLVVSGLRDAGFLPFSVAQSGSRDEGKRSYTRHMIRLRRDGQAIVGDSHPEIILVNSHDGTSAYHMHFGWFRLVCSNGMVVTDGPSSEIKVTHSGNSDRILDAVIGGARQLVGSVEAQADEVQRFRSIQLAPAEAKILADGAIDVRFDEFMADDVATVERVYDLAGQPFTPAVKAAMDAFMAEHPRGRHGAVLYDPGQLGIDPDERRRALAFYSERFGVTAEL